MLIKEKIMDLNELKIENIIAKIPIIQGGMAVRISTAKLAAAVANEGGIGIIAGTGMTVKELVSEIRKARAMTKGIIGVNVLFAVKNFADLVKGAMNEKIDLIVSGAGFSRDMFSWGKEYNTPIVPIVSSGKLAALAQKLGASAVVAEGKEAGGHLGTDRPMAEIVCEVLSKVQIPVIAAGGIINGKDIKNALELGAKGVQMGTIFAASIESNASDKMKKLYLKATKQDMAIINSPVGLPGLCIKNEFYNSLKNGLLQNTHPCENCLKRCNHNFCIMEALVNACDSNYFDKALVFAGEKVSEIKEILSVKNIFKNLLGEVKGEY